MLLLREHEAVRALYCKRKTKIQKTEISLAYSSFYAKIGIIFDTSKDRDDNLRKFCNGVHYYKVLSSRQPSPSRLYNPETSSRVTLATLGIVFQTMLVGLLVLYCPVTRATQWRTVREVTK